MGEQSDIEWTDSSWTPWERTDDGGRWYCEKLSPGCDNCYASMFNVRLGGDEYPPAGQGLNPAPLALSEKRLREPLRWRKPRRIFLSSMTDVFGEWVSTEQLDRIFAVISLTPQHTYQVLTKRPRAMKAYITDEATPFRITRARDQLLVSEMASKVARDVRPIPGYPGYFVSNDGVVYSSNGNVECRFCGGAIATGQAQRQFCSQSCRNKSLYYRKRGQADRFGGRGDLRPMRTYVDGSGYLRLMLIRDGKRERVFAHRLVLTAFDRPRKDDEVGLHRDGNKTNNHIANLYWGSQADNMADRKRHGIFRTHFKLTAAQAKEIRQRAAREGGATAKLAAEFGVNRGTIHKIATGQWWNIQPAIDWPLKNCWLGVSVELDRFVWRAQVLAETPAAVRFVSAEPLLGPLPSLQLAAGHKGPERSPGCPMDVFLVPAGVPPRCIDPAHYTLGIDWLIAGGESGHRHRPLDLDWIRDLRDRCQQSGTAFFFKQVGGRTPKAGGRLLDGQTWDEYPQTEVAV